VLNWKLEAFGKLEKTNLCQARCGSSCVEKYIFKSKQLYHLFHQITKCTYNAIDNKNIFEKLFGSILFTLLQVQQVGPSQFSIGPPLSSLAVQLAGVQ